MTHVPTQRTNQRPTQRTALPRTGAPALPVCFDDPVDAAGVHAPGGDAEVGRTRASRVVRARRAAPAAVTGAVLVLLGLFDLVAVELRWPLLVFAAVVVLAVVARGRAGRPGDALTAAALATSGAGTAAMALIGGAATWGVSESAALLLLLVARARRAAGARAWVLVAASVVAVVALPLRLRILDPDTPLYVALLAVAAAVAVAVAVALRGADTQHRLAEAGVRRAEREEVARELHDVVAHHVTGIVVATQAARVVAGATPGSVPPAVSAALATIEAAGAEAMGSMRRLVGVLRTDPVAPAGGRSPTPRLADVAELVQRFRDAGAVGAVELRLPDGGGSGAPEVPAEVQAGVYRVVQESLTNVARHAPGAARVDVEVACARAGLTVRVANTRGRDAAPPGAPAGAPAHPGGFGVLGMQERVAALGGTLTAGPQGPGGWAVEAAVPVPGPTRRPGSAR